MQELRGVLEREKAGMGLLISLQPPTKDMVAEAVSPGFYEHRTNQQRYPRLQLRTVKEKPGCLSSAHFSFSPN
jgi:site-specific DNA-methyltransferase (adenine-specific)